MNTCPKCGAKGCDIAVAEMFNVDTQTGVIEEWEAIREQYECGSLQGIKSFKQTDECRIAELEQDRDRLRRLVRCETIQPPADVTDDQTTELAVELAYLKEERDRLAAIVAKTPQWLPGGAQGGALEMEFGDHFIAAVRVCSADKSKEWWELSVVEITSIAQDDTGEYYGLSVDGCGWGWDWGDVEWYIPVKAIEETLPPYEAERKGQP